jgi:hypothetical protein
MRTRSMLSATMLGLVLAGGVAAGQVAASENAASLYLLGSGGPGTAIMPPLKGVFFDNLGYVYDGELGGSGSLPAGGNVLVDAKGTIIADFASLLWVPSANFAGGTLGVGGILPYGHLNLEGSAILTGPLGHQFTGAASDSAWIVGDPVAMAMLGWKMGDLHVQLANLLNVPIGGYRDGQLANLSFHRWADDLSLAATWHSDTSGWDVSGKTGLTFNGTNQATNYRTGTELHAEAAVEKTLSKSWSLGVQGYYFQQLTNDSGSGALLGPFKGMETGVGVTAAYHFSAGRMPATLRGRVTQDLDAENRLKGTGVWLDFSVPLQLKMPAAAAD